MDSIVSILFVFLEAEQPLQITLSVRSFVRSFGTLSVSICSFEVPNDWDKVFIMILRIYFGRPFEQWFCKTLWNNQLFLILGTRGRDPTERGDHGLLHPDRQLHRWQPDQRYENIAALSLKGQALEKMFCVKDALGIWMILVNFLPSCKLFFFKHTCSILSPCLLNLLYIIKSLNVNWRKIGFF